ncbi:MAG: enoyl-CoA hydratase/isomerase family protein [Solirubrobacteraceae bacterium]
MTALDLETIAVRQADGVAWLTLNRPQTLNAWTLQLGRELTRALDDAAHDDGVRAIVLTGAGRAFSSGADLRERAGDDADVGSALERVYNPLIMRVRTLPKPVIAAVNGPAVGIGCSLALACDLIVAARSAYFLMAFVNVGLGLDGGASQTLIARVGHARAFEIAYLGDRIAAEQALAWGLVNQVADDDKLEACAAALAARLATGPPRSFAAIKRTLNHRAYDGFEQLLALEAEVQRSLLVSGDFAEGVTAFLQKRPARFTGA